MTLAQIGALVVLLMAFNVPVDTVRDVEVILLATQKTPVVMIELKDMNDPQMSMKDMTPKRQCPVVAEDGIAGIGRVYTPNELLILNRNCSK